MYRVDLLVDNSRVGRIETHESNVVGAACMNVPEAYEAVGIDVRRFPEGTVFMLEFFVLSQDDEFIRYCQLTH